MAKPKKTKEKGVSYADMSPEKYIRKVARTLPIDKCYINNDWQSAGIASVVVTRRRPGGNLVVGQYLVDTWCLGVKDTFFHHNMPADEFAESVLGRLPETTKEISYPEVHNLILGAVEFAEEGGVSPHPDFEKTTEYILAEDDDSIPLIEYSYGFEGKHHLVVGPEGRERIFISALSKKLGDNFTFTDPVFPDDDDLFDNKIYEEPWHYDYPDYPTELKLKHPEVWDTLSVPEYMTGVPEEVSDRLLALPHPELATDLAHCILFEIGRTHASIDANTFPDNEQPSVIYNSVMQLTRFSCPEAWPALHELLRMNDDFVEVHLGDAGLDMLSQAIYRAVGDNLPPLYDYMAEAGRDEFLRWQAANTMCLVATLHPEKRGEVISFLSGLLDGWTSEYEASETPFPGNLAGMIVSLLINMNAESALPAIERIYSTYCIDDTVCGPYADVEQDMSRHDRPKLQLIDYSEFLNMLN